jgi:hypothetical protein
VSRCGIRLPGRVALDISVNGQAEQQHEVRTSFHDEAEDSVKDHDARILDAYEGDGKGNRKDNLPAPNRLEWLGECIGLLPSIEGSFRIFDSVAKHSENAVRRTMLADEWGKHSD